MIHTAPRQVSLFGAIPTRAISLLACARDDHVGDPIVGANMLFGYGQRDGVRDMRTTRALLIRAADDTNGRDALFTRRRSRRLSIVHPFPSILNPNLEQRLRLWGTGASGVSRACHNGTMLATPFPDRRQPSVPRNGGCRSQRG